MGSQFDSIVRAIQVYFESLHVWLGWRRIEVIASGSEYIIAVIDASIQCTEVKTTKGRPASRKSRGLRIPRRDICGVKVVG